MKDIVEMTYRELRVWAKTARVGEYLKEWDRSSGNHDGEYDDATYALCRQWLRGRNLTLKTDDRGVYVAYLR